MRSVQRWICQQQVAPFKIFRSCRALRNLSSNRCTSITRQLESGVGFHWVNFAFFLCCENPIDLSWSEAIFFGTSKVLVVFPQRKPWDFWKNHLQKTGGISCFWALAPTPTTPLSPFPLHPAKISPATTDRTTRVQQHVGPKISPATPFPSFLPCRALHHLDLTRPS